MAVEADEPGPLRSLVRHTLIYGSGFVATAAVSLILVPVYTHYFTPSEYGLLALMLVLYGVGKQIYDLGFTNSVGRFFFDESEDHEASLREMRATSLVFLAIWGGALTAGLCVFAGNWSNLLTNTPIHADLVRIVSITLFAETLGIVPLTLIRMQERSGLFLGVTIVRLAIALGLSIVFVVGLAWGVRGALLANMFAALAITAALLLDQARTHTLSGHFSWPLLRQMLAFALPFFPVLLSTWIIEASDRYLLEVFRTRAEVGWYSLAYRIAQVMQLGVAAFLMGWAPLRYRIYERPDARAVYRRLTNAYVLVASLPAVAIALFAEPIVALVAPPSYAPATTVVPLVLLSYVLQGLYYMTITGMGVTKRTNPMAWVAATGAIVNVGINLVAIPQFGMKGAAATTVLAYAVMVGGSWYASQKVYPIPFDWPRIAQVGAIGIGVVGIASIFSPRGNVADGVWATIALLTFLVLLIKTRAVEPGEMQIVRGAARTWMLRARRLVVRPH